MPKVMFLDETGDHSLAKIDPEYPVFALCGVIMDEQYHRDVAVARLDAFKAELFGTNKFVLHTADFTRNKAGFEPMTEHAFRARFFDRLQNLITDLDFKIVACVIKKQPHLQKYGLGALDPYLLSLSVLVERFVFECGSAGGSIVAEARDITLNNALELAFLDLKISGTTYIPASKVRSRIHSFAIREKRENIAGLQVADVIATPIGRHSIGKSNISCLLPGRGLLFCASREIPSELGQKDRRNGIDSASKMKLGRTRYAVPTLRDCKPC